ncbi:YicC/YloC family endoribonuclease [Yoonia litorea]|uniref:TIGR00255 family protein n=1 Tax=Yoonia litorea TaxID=1123755 RepID=A0A1I6M3E8_9RHOB|nr:YicC/YloC family endoribonuclease [Yoonia litorea]SFS10247.1 TIGR00255 family protein [Yoonia litorea]
MTHSMTAFASKTGHLGSVSWVWEMRGVNARGLDLRLRLPDSIEGLEPALRKALTAQLSRGNVTVNLRLTRTEEAQPLSLDAAQLDTVLQALDQIQERAFAMGVTLGQPTAADVLSQRGVLVAARNDDQTEALAQALMAEIAPLVAEFVAMRATEGAALAEIISRQLDEIERLTHAADAAAQARAPQTKAALTTAMQRVLEEVADLDEARLAQELAVLAVKSDVTEEIDRLKAHVAAARDLLAQDKPAGRKLDFLAQEFNREANTLCSKAQATDLTAIGLDLKAVIDQMREQIQNVE